MADYVDGKADWMAHGLPVEGEAGPFLTSALAEAPLTAAPGDRVDAVAARLRRAGVTAALVTSPEGLVLGRYEPADDDDPGAALLEVMAGVPATVRPSLEIGDLEAGRSVTVTAADGRLLGVATGPPGGSTDVAQEVHDLAEAVAEHFGDRTPSEDEVEDFLRQRQPPS